tara:strand:- start:4221 stop:4730 length:510 start_codon:yes stop_codon:yes gene_type:complete
MNAQHIRVLDLVRERIARAGFAPTLDELGDELNLSKTRVWNLVNGLVLDGLLERKKSTTRGLSLPGEPDLRAVPDAALTAELARRGMTLESLNNGKGLAFGRAVSCAADCCQNEVRRGQLFCLTHWRELPQALQHRILSTHRARDVDAYQAAVSEARDGIDSARWRTAR